MKHVIEGSGSGVIKNPLDDLDQFAKNCVWVGPYVVLYQLLFDVSGLQDK